MAFIGAIAGCRKPAPPGQDVPVSAARVTAQPAASPGASTTPPPWVQPVKPMPAGLSAVLARGNGEARIEVLV
jgi:hypothetical protein